MNSDEERNKTILEHFGKLLLTPSLAESLSRSAEFVQRAEQEYTEVMSARLLYNQCAYGL